MVGSISIKNGDCYRSSSIYCFILSASVVVSVKTIDFLHFIRFQYVPFFSSAIVDIFECIVTWILLISSYHHDPIKFTHFAFNLAFFCYSLSYFTGVINYYYWISIWMIQIYRVCFILSWIFANNQFAWSPLIHWLDVTVWKYLEIIKHIDFFFLH